MTLTIARTTHGGTHKTGTLMGYTKDQLESVFGESEKASLDGKAQYSWEFDVVDENEDSFHCGIWDWKGSWEVQVWSTFGPADMIQRAINERLSK